MASEAMPDANGDIDIETACPYLGLVQDSRTHFAFATPAHRCHAKRRPAPVDLRHQATFCLTPGFPACKRFPAGAGAPRVVAAQPSLDAAEGRLLRRTPVIDVAPRIVPGQPTVAVVSAPPAPRPQSPGTSPSATQRPLLIRLVIRLLALALFVLIAVVVVLASGVTGPRPSVTGSTSVSGAPAQAVPSANDIGTASPTAISTPVQASTSPAAPSRSVGATPAVARGRTYVVRPGDTLTSIAERYDVTPQAIRRTNRISDPNFLRIGQRLVIPMP